MDSMDNGHEMRIGFLYRLQQELSRYRHQLQTDQRLQHCSTAAHDATAAVMVPTVATCSAAALLHSFIHPILQLVGGGWWPPVVAMLQHKEV